ncbi:MAG: MFS transporter [Asgard group archaeon]|nr:MFS transporter [Asgard group archaeon]
MVLVKDDEKEVALEAKETRKGNTILWYFYDAADNFFSQTVISLAFTPYALLLGVEKGWDLVTTFIIVSLFMAGSNLLIAIFGPILGALSDTSGKRKPWVITVATIMVLTTAITTVWVNFWWAAVLFVIGNFCYQAGRMFYDSQIPFVTDSARRSVYQAIGGALAPIGSFLGIAAGIAADGIFGEHTTVNTAIWELSLESVDLNYTSLRWLFAIAAGVLAIMCIPYLFHKEVENPSGLTRKESLKTSLGSVKTSLKAIVTDKNSILFFLGWFFMIDAANTTILYMVPVVEGACGVTSTLLTYIIIGLGILLSVVFGIVTGYMLKRLGPKNTFIISGFGWMIAIVLFMFAGLQYNTTVVNNITFVHYFPWWIAFFGAFFIGIGFGGVWIIGRQFIMVLAPPSKLAQYAGFQKIAGRVSAIVSPLIFSGMMFIGDSANLIANHSYRIALVSILFFFIIGTIFIFFIRDPYHRYNAGERAPYPGIYDKKQE